MPSHENPSNIPEAYEDAIENVDFQEFKKAETELHSLLREMGQLLLNGNYSKEEAEKIALEKYGPRMDAAMRKSRIALDNWLESLGQ